MTVPREDNAVVQILWPREVELLELRARWHALNVFAEELHEATGGRPFEIRGDAAWRWVIDGREMFVIDLASWAKSLVERGGLLGIITARHVAHFSPEYARNSEASELARATRREAFFRLFPAARGRRGPTHADFEALRTRFRDLAGPVLTDRSEHRAHRYELASRKATSKFTPHPEFGQYLDAMAALFNDIRAATGESSLAHYDDAAAARDPRGQARDMVDAVLLGDSLCRDLLTGTADAVRRATGSWPIEHRNALYAKLRELALHDAADEVLNSDERVEVVHVARGTE